MPREPRPVPGYSPTADRHDERRARLFERRFRSAGGRLILSDAPDDSLVRYYRLRYWDYLTKYVKEPAYHEVLARTYLDFVRNDTLNAVASRQASTYLIGCYKGAVYNISFFFRVILTHPDILPKYGDPSQEVRWYENLASCDWRMPLPIIIRSIPHISRPKTEWPCDPLRKNLAQQLATFAIDFLFFHEMGHLVNRHIDYVRDRYGCDFEELNARGGRYRSPDFRALELAADSFAVGEIASIGLFRDRLPKAKGKVNTFISPSEALRVWTLAVGFLFLLFDPYPLGLEDYSSSSHPHPAVRLRNVVMTSMAIAQQASSTVSRRTDRYWKRALGDIWSICHTLQMPAAVLAASGAVGVEASNERELLAAHLDGIVLS
jgi:hypothetical protein